MAKIIYKVGFCKYCHINVQHFRSAKTLRARALDLCSLYILNFGPWYCGQCERSRKFLRWVRRSEPVKNRIDDGGEPIGNFLRSDGSLVMRKKRSSRYTQKFREGVVDRLLNGRTSIGQLTIELEVSEADLLAWVGDLLNSKDQRISELTSLLRSYHRAAENLIGISDDSAVFDEEENMIEGHFKHSADPFHRSP